MLNTELLLYFAGYILTLLIGFAIKRNKKDNHNKIYKRYKKPLFLLIVIIFFSTTSLLMLLSQLERFFYTLFIINILFACYVLTLSTDRSRCWKQHRMILYNFVAIYLFYLGAQFLNNPNYLIGILIIYIYNLLEFQFAKFSFKQPLLWN